MESLIEDVELKKKELSQSAFLAALARTLKTYTSTAREIRFLAVGNFGDTPWPAYQTAVALWLQETLDARCITAWDPNFRKRDLKVLSGLGIAVKQQDPKDLKDVLFFVPHAPYFLEPELLKRVGKCVYIGNDLTLNDANTTRNPKQVSWYAEGSRTVPVKVKPKDPWREAFKNTAFHQYADEKTSEKTSEKTGEKPIEKTKLKPAEE